MLEVDDRSLVGGNALTDPGAAAYARRMRLVCNRRLGRPRVLQALVALFSFGVALVVALPVLWPARAAGGHGAGANAASSFVSLYPLYSPSEIDQYSLGSGRQLGALAPVPSSPDARQGSSVSNPHLRADGDYVITLGHGARCATSHGACHPIANTCASQIETIDPATQTDQLLFSVSGAWLVDDAVPSPNGRSIALVENACNGKAARLVVRDLRSGHQRIVARHLSACGLDSSVTWTRNGTKLAFAYARHQNPDYPTSACALAVAPAAPTAQPANWTFIQPDAKCSFQSAASDAIGLVATESCTTSAGNELVQMAGSGRVIRRVSLQPDYSRALTVASDPWAHTVLVSQVVPTEPDESWVWTFDGSKLHLVRYYFGADIAAEP